MEQYIDLYPQPSADQLRRLFVGRSLKQVPLLPAAVVDRAIVKRHCVQMLETCDALGVAFRPHTKTHKTIEATELQVGKATRDVRLVVSTIAEAEFLDPYIRKCLSEDKQVNVLYGMPCPMSQLSRVIRLSNRWRPSAVSVLIDHPDQLLGAIDYSMATKAPLQIFVKIDTGYHRAGLKNSSASLRELLNAVTRLETNPEGPFVELQGFYSHAGHSYGSNNTGDTQALLREEIDGLEIAAAMMDAIRRDHASKLENNYILSVGATPTITSTLNLSNDPDSRLSRILSKYSRHTATERNNTLEFHAGVYPFLDLQQLATNSTSISRSHADIALTILTEVASLYTEEYDTDRKNDDERNRALIPAGSLALGREPCKSYDGYGRISSWNTTASSDDFDTGTNTKNSLAGWTVCKVSQEHGILMPDTAAASTTSTVELEVGQRLRIYPNHACVAGAGFDWYLVVDSHKQRGQEAECSDEIVAVWIRGRGW